MNSDLNKCCSGAFKPSILSWWQRPLLLSPSLGWTGCLSLYNLGHEIKINIWKTKTDTHTHWAVHWYSVAVGGCHLPHIYPLVSPHSPSHKVIVLLEPYNIAQRFLRHILDYTGLYTGLQCCTVHTSNHTWHTYGKCHNHSILSV